MATILTKKKDTTGAPVAGDLTNSSGGAELAVNTADKRLYTKDSGGNVVEVGTNPGTAVTFTAGTVSAPAITTTGDTNTGVFFPAADTIAFAEGGTESMRLNSSGQVVTTAGTVSLPAITTTGDTNTGIFFPAADTIAFAEGGAEAMRIDSSGNVLVGATSPTANASGRGDIEVNGSSSSVLALNVGGTLRGYILHQGTSMNVQNTQNGDMLFATNNTERARITSGGDFYVGSTGLPTTAGFGVVNYSGGTYTRIAHNTSAGSSDGYIQFFYNSTQIGSVAQNGTSAVQYLTSSDYRLKENIAPMTGALDTVSALKPCTYTWKADGSVGQGFIAHELQAVVPDCVNGEKDATEVQNVEVSPAVPATYDDEGNELTPAVEAVYEQREVPKYQGVDTSFLVATLTAAIQELKAITDAQTTRIEALEAEVAAMKAGNGN